VGVFIPGSHGKGALLAQVVLTRTVSFADDFAGARAHAGVSATAETVLDVHRNGSPIGTITFGTGASAGFFATVGGGAETFAAGDRLAIINENPAGPQQLRRGARWSSLPLASPQHVPIPPLN
jgi:hypothetical protein